MAPIKSSKKSKRHSTVTKNVLENITMVHGLRYLVQNKRRRLGWIVIFVGNIVFTIYLFLVIKERYDSNQIITRVDATCRVNQVPFPSVIICNANVVSMKETKKIEGILKLNGRSAAEIEEFFTALSDLVHFGYRSDLVQNFTEIMDIMTRHYFSIDTIMEEVHQKCEDLLLYCSFNKKEKKCSDVFNHVKTMEGYCCAFNYAALNDLNEGSVFENDDDIEYYDDRDIGSILSTSKSGRSSGLSVLFNVDSEDYPPWSKAFFQGAKILISDPNDFPETTVITKYLEQGESMDILVEPMIFLSDVNIRRVPLDQRNCWFHDELKLDHTDRYSYETCQTECRMKIYMHDCGCVPFKYPREMNARICEFKDIACLHNITVYDSNFTCNCYLECSDKKYITKVDSTPLTSRELQKHITHNYNLQQLAAVRVYFAKSTCNCYKKTLLMGIDIIIGTYGGVFSLSVGASILTFVEILFLLFSCSLSMISKKNKQK